MPQLVKGGKYIFGLSKIGPHGKIRIPEEALIEYRLGQEEKVILMQGSKKSGGFGVTSLTLLKDSIIKKALESYPDLVTFHLPEGSMVQLSNRYYCWLTIHDEGILYLTKEIMKCYGIEQNSILFVARGSGLAIGFGVRGPIHEVALSHPECKLFQ